MPIDQHGDEVLHSLYGRKFGLDKGGYAVGLPGVRVPYEASTAGSTLTAWGLSVLSGSSAANSWTLTGPPAVGVQKMIVNNSSASTATLQVIRSSSDSGVTFLGSTGGSTGGVNIGLVGHGAAVTLVGISTSQWAVVGTATYATTAQAYVSVSTSS